MLWEGHLGADVGRDSRRPAPSPEKATTAASEEARVNENGSLIAEIQDALLTSYRVGGAVNTRGTNLPSRSALAAFLHQVDEVVFPGFSRDEIIDEETLPFATSHKLCLLQQAAEDLVARDLRATARQRDTAREDADVASEARAIARGFLRYLPELRDLVLLDVDALCAGDPAAQSNEEVILAYPGLRAVLVHRVAHHFWQAGSRLLARMMSEYIHSTTGIDIHPGAQIGKHFHIDHGTGVVIGETCIIGDYVKIYQGVSLGALSVSRSKVGQKRHPTICDHVTIYAGATILGGETLIGHHSVVGGNVWLVESVPPYSVVENQASIKVRSKADLDAGAPTWSCSRKAG